MEVGKFASSSPGPARFNINDPLFYLSADTFDRVSKELGVLHDNMMPCNSAKNIVYSFNGFFLQITPDDYMDKTNQRDGYCFFNAKKGKPSPELMYQLEFQPVGTVLKCRLESFGAIA